VAVDRVVAQYLGLWNSDALGRELGGHKTSPLLEVAAKRFGVDIASPTVTGDGASLLAAPRPAHLIGMAGFEIDEAGAGHEDSETKEGDALALAGEPPAVARASDDARGAAAPPPPHPHAAGALHPAPA